MALGFPGDPAGRVFVQQRAFPSRRIRSDGQGAAAGQAGQKQPKRAHRAARFGGPAVGCWAAGPGAGKRPRGNGPWAVFPSWAA